MFETNIPHMIASSQPTQNRSYRISIIGLTSMSQRWSEPELKPLVSESSGLLERESKKEPESRRFVMRAMLGNFSKKSAVMLMDSGGR